MTMKRTLRVSMVTSALMLALVTLTSGPKTFGVAPAQVEIKIDNFTFTPNTITVPVGTEVRWTNHDDIPHTVVSDDKAIKSKVLDTDEQFTYKFTKAGTYNYFCSIHPKMTAKVVVQ